jgi:hypothetical protein
LLKILYAASNRKGSALQLNRFLKSIDGEDYVVKIAAFKRSDYATPIDWTLNALLDITRPHLLKFEDNEMLKIYYSQVKSFAPDLIISDLELFTSHIANDLNIPIWQVSPLLSYIALEDRQLHLKLHYNYIINKQNHIKQRINNLLFNSDRCYVYSHFGDLLSPPQLRKGFQWIRPFHVIGKQSDIARHEFVAISPSKNLKLLNLLNEKSDSVLFTSHFREYYSRIVLKDIDNVSELSCNLKNCARLISIGHTDLLADSFYNGKYPLIIPDFTDEESLINSVLSECFGTGSLIYDFSGDLPEEKELPEVKYNPEIAFLHEKIKEFEKALSIKKRRYIEIKNGE